MMKSGSKENKGDRLSELPDEVIVHVLSFLPTLDAVRTMLLRRFGNLWTLVKTLKFEEICFKSDGNRSDDDRVLDSRFVLFVLNVLILHKRPTIDKFVIRMENDVYWDEARREIAEVEAWIRFAVNREATALTLEFSSKYFPVHSSILTSQSLVRLNLAFCSIQLPSRVHMGSLRTLELYCVNVDDDSFNRFVSSCPSLYELVIWDVDNLEVVSFSAPSIEKLEFVWEGEPDQPWTIDCPYLKILDFSMYFYFVEVLKVPSVREVTIDFGIFSPEYQVDAHQVKRCLEGFPNAEVLTFRDDIDLLLLYCSKANMAFPQNRWRRVVLDSSFQNTCVAAIIYSLVRNSPCLEELVINVYQHTAIYSTGVKDSNLVSQEVTSPCVAPYLKVVSMHGYAKCYEGQLQLAKFLLESAVTLDKLIFTNQGSELTSEKELQFLKKISSFPRASANAKILFE